MSNSKKATDPPPEPESPQTILLTEENKEEVRQILGYSPETIDNILQKAADQGFKGVTLPILGH